MSAERDISKEPKGAFWVALAESTQGDRIIYHTGAHCGGEHRADASTANEIGLAILVQRRSKEQGKFDYLAVRTKKEAEA